jgi:hypothetical protein
MRVEKLVELIHLADRKQSGCTVTFAPTLSPYHSLGVIFGWIRYGVRDYRFTFITEKELVQKLQELGK